MVSQRSSFSGSDVDTVNMTSPIPASSASTVTCPTYENSMDCIFSGEHAHVHEYVYLLPLYISIWLFIIMQIKRITLYNLQYVL